MHDVKSLAHHPVQTNRQLAGHGDLGGLRTLDMLVRNDHEIVYYEKYAVWSRIANKGKQAFTNAPREGDYDSCATELYERRLEEQQRILNGKIKRGHKAFDFYPLDGGG